MEASRPADFSHYLGIFRRHWWIAVIATGAGLGAGTALTGALPKVYESSTSVQVQALDVDTNATGGRTKDTVNLDTEAQLVRSGAVAVKAAALMRTARSPLELARRDVSVEVPANTTVLVITFRAGTPQVVVPQGGDQAYWGSRVTALGIGAAHDGPTPTFESLAAALRTALAPEMQVRAAAVAGTIRTDGAAVAARLLVDEVSREQPSAAP